MDVLDDCIGVDVLSDIRLLPLLLASQLLLLLNLNHLHDIGPFLGIHFFELILHIEQHLCRCVSVARHLLRGERRHSTVRLSQNGCPLLVYVFKSILAGDYMVVLWLE